jgi:hypothetical protein
MAKSYREVIVWQRAIAEEVGKMLWAMIQKL